MVEEMRSALLRGDNAQALRLLRRFTGIENDEAESDRINPSLH